jgi:hypothetical protein
MFSIEGFLRSNRQNLVEGNTSHEESYIGGRSEYVEIWASPFLPRG